MTQPGDRAVTTGAVFAFSTALGVSNVALPLLALAAGYGAAAIGALTATSAAAQLLVRATVATVARRHSDRFLMTSAAAALGLSCVLVSLSTVAWVFVLAELCQGAARAYFWTGSQLHVMHGANALRGVARINLTSGLGGLLGPVLAGLLAEGSPVTATVTAAAIATAGLLLCAGTHRNPPQRGGRRAKAAKLWRSPSLRSGCWASATAGTWGGLLTSYVPVILTQAGHSAHLVGILVGTANGANIVGSYVVGRIRLSRLGRGYPALVLGTAVSIVALSVLAFQPLLSAAALVTGGLGAGALLTLGPVLASDRLTAAQRPDALAATGTFRASALLLSPLTVAGASAVLATAPAMAAVGAIISIAALGRPRTGTG